jgi:hypothetical protein
LAPRISGLRTVVGCNALPLVAQESRGSRPPSLTPAQQKEVTKRRTQGATLPESANSYDRSISTMRRATRTA